ncbi:PE-PGRS family protein [Streptomyces sp. HNM0574]|uniref:PE-PGRS family protein n=1 Tax=Streptomyces sp. HNM0574 TaxID=2714954 RepID=UPI00146F84E1|nr:PE-PGRS family protein [Streptomyces sp. HNM0574]NLU68617.1 PE-PGRS family protein [Streptomyces sp. HNM0574]
MSPMGAGWVLRAVRTGVFATACVLLAALGHALMSGAPVPVHVLLPACAATAAAAWPLAGRERGPVLVGTLTLATQAGLHLAFSLGQAGASSHTGAVMAHPLPHSMPHSMARAMTHAAHGGHGADGAHPAQHGGSGMLAAHLLVALLCAWWLWCGERAAFRLVRAASARLFAPLSRVVRPVLPAPAPRVPTDGDAHRRGPRALFLTHVIWLRGPPYAPAA